ncbi:hypothetical protein VTK26DRAFT_3085 [Humicola hyalothermophila]
MDAFPSSGMFDEDLPPLLTLSSASDPAGLEFAALLQQPEDLGYLAEESGGSSLGAFPATSPSSGALSDASVTTTSPVALAVRPAGGGRVIRPAVREVGVSGGDRGAGTGGAKPQQKPRLERRGHTKSRRGCFHCKRRRIKCQETRPACGHCIKQGLKCEYPAMPTIVHQPQQQIPIFTLQDMRFFQHFLTYPPHHPIGAEQLWTHEVPCLSHKYEFLMHAMLGFAASCLIPVDRSYIAAALEHRLKSIRAIKKMLADAAAADPRNQLAAAAVESSRASTSPSPSTATAPPPMPPPTPAGSLSSFEEEGNALVATCYALTFQSVLLEDGMAEFMTFIRGIIIVAIQLYCRGVRLLFGHHMGSDHQREALEPHMTAVPLIERGRVDRAVEAVRGLEGLVSGEGREVERRFWEGILRMAEECRVSSWLAYQAIMDHYGWWIQLPHDQFRRIVDPTNQVAVLLAAHWQAVEEIMAPITDAETKAAAVTNRPSGPGPGAGGYSGWLRYLNRLVDDEHLKYNEWPLWVEAELARDRGCFGRAQR